MAKTKDVSWEIRLGGLLSGALMALLFGLCRMGIAGEPLSTFTLRVLSYNIHGLPVPNGALDHSRYADVGRILKARLAGGTAPHIVAIQEAFHARTRELVREAGYPYVSYGPAGKGSRFNSGLVLLSQFPILSTANIVYSQCTSWDCLSRKGAQLSQIQVPGVPQPVVVLNTHLNAYPDPDFWTPPEDATAARLAQVQELREFIWEKKASHAPGFFVGDFNFLPSHYEYLSFVSFLNVDSASERCARTFECTGEDDPFKDWHTSVDHQFYLSGLSPRVQVQPVHFEKNFKEAVKGRELSDHHGLEVHYRLAW